MITHDGRILYRFRLRALPAGVLIPPDRRRRIPRELLGWHVPRDPREIVGAVLIETEGESEIEEDV